MNISYSMVVITCQRCGIKFDHRVSSISTSPKKFCSKCIKDKFNDSIHRDKEIRICIVCNKPLIKINSICHGGNCYDKYYSTYRTDYITKEEYKSCQYGVWDEYNIYI